MILKSSKSSPNDLKSDLVKSSIKSLNTLVITICELVTTFQEHPERDLLWQDARHCERPALCEPAVRRQASGRAKEGPDECAREEKRRQGIDNVLEPLFGRFTMYSRQKEFSIALPTNLIQNVIPM
jgi:hypothetical protein